MTRLLAAILQKLEIKPLPENGQPRPPEMRH